MLFELFYVEEEERRRNQENFRQLNLFRRRLRDMSDPFTMPAHHFIKYYRMAPEVTLRLIRLLENQLVAERSTSIPIHLQVLITLRFMAEGSLQKGLCQEFLHPIGQSTASRCIRKVQDAILRFHHVFIKFPTTPHSRQAIQEGFQRTIRIPGVLGVVDGFLVNLRRPSENEEAFFNYRVGPSMNVQIIVDSNYNILNVRICPGSNNDKFIWQYSQAKEYMEYLRSNANIVEQEGNYYILGDSGYTPSPILLTPILNSLEGSPESFYTTDFVGTRRIVEQTIGLLTNVWMAIKRCRQLHYSPLAVARIINVACCLHNFRRKHGIFDIIQNQPNNLVIPRQNFPRHNDYAAGIAERNRIVEEFYS